MTDVPEKMTNAGELEIPSEDSLLMRLYSDIGVPLDALPYTDQFDELFAKFSAQFESWNKAEVFRRLTNLRKQGMLPRLARPRDAG